MNIKTKTASARFIFATMFLDAMGIGLVIPFMPDMIRRFGADPGFVNHYYGYFVAVYALMQFVASPVIGSLSDRFGRRPVLLVSLLGAGLDYILMAFAPNLLLLFVGRVIAGLTGASMTVATAYMADISTDENRSTNFGMIGAAFGLGFIAGPLIGGILGADNHSLPFLAAAAFNLMNFAFGYLILPESLPKESRRQIDLKKLNPFISVKKIFQPSPILLLIWVYLLLFLAGHVHPSIWTLYTQYKFEWTPKDVGFSLAFVGLTVAIAQGGLTRIIIPKLGEQRTTFWGIVVDVIAFTAFALATKGWMMYAVMCVNCLAFVAGPALQSMLSKETPSNEQGELQGTLVALSSLTAIIGPLLYTGLFDVFTEKTKTMVFPGAPYIGAALICLVCLILLRFKTVKRTHG